MISGGAQSKRNNRPKNNRQRYGGAGLSHVGGARSKQVGCMQYRQGCAKKKKRQDTFLYSLKENK